MSTSSTFSKPPIHSSIEELQRNYTEAFTGLRGVCDKLNAHADSNIAAVKLFCKENGSIIGKFAKAILDRVLKPAGGRLAFLLKHVISLCIDLVKLYLKFCSCIAEAIISLAETYMELAIFMAALLKSIWCHCWLLLWELTLVLWKHDAEQREKFITHIAQLKESIISSLHHAAARWVGVIEKPAPVSEEPALAPVSERPAPAPVSERPALMPQAG
ncbi:MAG: hypothetical protein LBJ94_02910 [Puniceicoccales bacterium]|jgi:hypothetical protein|nr:hypothetical protein [Puniceicoccales bacterium]